MSERLVIASIVTMVRRPSVVWAPSGTAVFRVVGVAVVAVSGAAAATLSTERSRTVHVNKVALHSARLVLTWATIVGILSVNKANSASYPQLDGNWVLAKVW